MDAFVGKWKLTSSKNFNEYMKAIESSEPSLEDERSEPLTVCRLKISLLLFGSVLRPRRFWYEWQSPPKGVGCCTRTCGCMNKPTTTISSKGPNNEKITIKTETCCRLTEVTFPLNHEFEEITMDNRDVRSYGTLEGGKLRICQKWDGRQTTLIREIVNGQLVLTLTAGKVVSTQIFKRAPK